MEVPHNDITPDYIFHLEYSAANLELHDQDHGKAYVFSVKAYNRAGLTTTASTKPYAMHSQTLPVAGKIYHVSPDNLGVVDIQEVGFQEDSSILCAKWTGFYHYSGPLQIMLGIGSMPGADDKIPATEVENDGKHCFDKLILPHLQTYYFIIVSSNTKGSVNVTSKGVFVAPQDIALQYARVDDGLGCQNDFVQLDQNVELMPEQQNSRDYILTGTLSSRIRATVAIEYEWNGQFEDLVLRANDQVLSHYSWSFRGNSVYEYFQTYFLKANETIHMLLGTHAGSLMIKSIGWNLCHRDKPVQSSTNGLKNSWTFRPEVQETVTHYSLAVHEFRCTATSCTDGGQIVTTRFVGAQTSFHHLADMILTEGSSYQTSISPCFGPTCISAVVSRGILVDPSPASSNLLSCTIKPNHEFHSIDNVFKDTVYSFDISWEALRQGMYGLRNPVYEVYDWSLALTPSGATLLLDWKRVKMQEHHVNVSDFL